MEEALLGFNQLIKKIGKWGKSYKKRGGEKNSLAHFSFPITTHPFSSSLRLTSIP